MADRELLAEGQEAEIFLQPDGTVVKLFRDPAHGWRRDSEVSALSILRDHGDVAAPRVVDVVMLEGRPGLVMERVEGTDLLSSLASRPIAVFKAGRVMAEAQLALHRCAAPDDLPDLNDVLDERIRAADALPDELRTKALVVLDELPRGDRLCHGDLHLGNILGAWAAPLVIDWADATRGDPLADVARTWLLHSFGIPPPGTSWVTRLLLPLGRQGVLASYMRTYARLQPLDRRVLERWKIVRAAARLWDPVPAEHPPVLRYLRRRLDEPAPASEG